MKMNSKNYHDTQPDLYLDIRKEVIEKFSFLNDYGFSEFTEKQLAHEYHFMCKNAYLSIDIWFELTYSTHINITFNQYWANTLYIDNSLVQRIEAKHTELYENALENNYLTIYLAEGKNLNALYLVEISKLIKQNKQILIGELDILRKSTDTNKKQAAEEGLQRKIDNKIYTLYFDAFGCECYEEFTDIANINSYLAEMNLIGEYKLLDWNLNEIKLNTT